MSVPLRLVEGEGPVVIRVEQYLPPEYHCIDLNRLTTDTVNAGLDLVLRMFQVTIKYKLYL